jgi:hypothetical protein
LDRYHSHTEHCRACSGALAAIRRWKTPLAQLPWLGLLLLILLPRPLGIAIGLAVAALGIALGSQLRRWERQLLQGDGRPPRNRD